MKLTSFLAAIVFGVATVAVPVFAQTTPAPNVPVAGGSTLGVSVSELRMVAIGYRASKLLGASVYNDENKKIGTVKDFVVTPTAYVSYVIVAVGGFLGLGQKDVAVPEKSFKDLNGRIILPGATAKQLEALPAFHFAR